MPGGGRHVRFNTNHVQLKRRSRPIQDAVQNICTSKATGLDNLPARFIKDSSPVIAAPLAHITSLNLSVISGDIPDNLKMARVVPIYKKSSKTDASNYRPMCVHS